MPSTKLIVFLKAARPGLVKTRLALSLGPSAAAEAYQRLVTSVLLRIERLNPVELRYAPDDAGLEIEPLLRQCWIARPQGTGNLGERMRAAFAQAFGEGFERVALIGSDCPDVRAEDVAEGWARLEGCDVVLGPALDGGYWMIALSKPHFSLFEGIPWSSDRVLAETLRRVEEAGLRAHLLRPLRDVDTEGDWRAFAGHDQPAGA